MARERGDQVCPTRERRPAGGVHPGAHLLRDDIGERGLAQAGGPVQEHVLHRLLALTNGPDGDGQALDEVRLPDVLRHARGTERPVPLVDLGVGFR